jgi:single-strand DNA-binding protein
MSKSVNKVLLLGNVGKEPDVKTAGSGTVVANFSIACSDRRKDAQGNWQDVTEWVDLVAFKRTAEIIRDYVRKGSKVYVEGKLQTRSWEKDGQKHYRTEVLISELVLLDGGGKREEPRQDNTAEISDEDLPF